MTTDEQSVYFVVDAKGAMLEHTLATTPPRALANYAFSFMPFDKMDALDVSKVWDIALKNGLKLKQLPLPKTEDAEIVSEMEKEA